VRQRDILMRQDDRETDRTSASCVVETTLNSDVPSPPLLIDLFRSTVTSTTPTDRSGRQTSRPSRWPFRPRQTESGHGRHSPVYRWRPTTKPQSPPIESRGSASNFLISWSTDGIFLLLQQLRILRIINFLELASGTYVFHICLRGILRDTSTRRDSRGQSSRDD